METRTELAERIAHDPDSASDSDKLRNVANWVDAIGPRINLSPNHTQVQDFLRGLAERLEGP